MGYIESSQKHSPCLRKGSEIFVFGGREGGGAGVILKRWESLCQCCVVRYDDLMKNVYLSRSVPQLLFSSEI